MSKVVDGCLYQMTDIQMNEVFTSWTQNNGSNWPAPLQASGWQNLTFDSLTGSWLLRDVLYEVPSDGKIPAVMNSGANGNDQSAGSLQSTHTQQFRAGSAYNGGPGGNPPSPNGPIPGAPNYVLGVLVQTNQHFHWLDHGSYQ